MKQQKREDDYTDRFIECQKKIKITISKVPVGVQNWDYEKTVRLKKFIKDCESKSKLQPKSKHVDFLRIERALKDLEVYYK